MSFFSGTSLPDLFASKSAAQNEQYADAAVGNVTGSNGVNVFLGLGIPWLIAAIYHKVNVSYGQNKEVFILLIDRIHLLTLQN